MPVKNFLSQEQKQNLQQALRESEQPELRERVLMLLLMNEGKTYEEIASFIGCSQRTVAYWCVHGDPDNLDSLQDKRRIGSYRKATDEYVKTLLETIDKEPSELGYEFGRWTGERLATYLAMQTGIELTGSQVRKILKQKKYVYLWAKYSSVSFWRGRVSSNFAYFAPKLLTRRIKAFVSSWRETLVFRFIRVVY